MEVTRPELVLGLPMVPDENDAGAASVREYLVNLLLELWREGESFYGKRPFGNSGWEDELYKPLVAAGFIAGTFDEYGDLGEDVDDTAGDDLITQAIHAML